MKQILLVAAGFTVLLLPERAHAQPLSAADTTAIVKAVLEEYRSVNGPVIHIVDTIACGNPAYWGPARLAERRPCRSAAADAAILPNAAQHGVEVVDVASSVPNCRWNNAESDGRKGLRLDLMAPGEVDGEIRVGFLTRCMIRSGVSPRGFMEAAVYHVGRVNGTWRILRIVSSLIT